MITITILKNPFDHSEKVVHNCEYIPGKTAFEYVQPHIMGLDEYVVSVNGEVTEEPKTQAVNSGDWLAVCPVVGKNRRDWFRAIASFTISYFIGKWFPQNGFWGNTLAAKAANAIGGALINHWFPPAKPDKIEAKSSYNWGNAQAQSGQGNALAVTYGTMRTAGQVLAQHVISEDENQYMSILLCGGEGPIDSISDIRINDNPISYYKGVTVETRLGTNDQTAITNFNDTYDDLPLAYELNTDNTWATQQTEGNAVEGLEVTLNFPGGLYHINDKGNLENASVTVALEFRKVGEANWSPFTTATITAAKNTAFFRTYRKDHLAAGQYEVRAKCTAKSGTSTRDSTRVFWTQLSSIMYDDFSRPGKVLIGIKALATNQLSGGMPAITWLQTREKVWVWNAETSRYEQKAATNPAWAAYDMIHRCRQIKNIHTGELEFIVQGVPVSRAVYQDFVRWAAFCDDRKLTFNYIYDTANDLWTQLQKPEGVGRGKVILRGTRFGCVCDAPGDPVQLFTVGNVLTDKFKETFVSMKDRANAIEVSFPNKDKAYEKEVIIVYSDDYDGATEPNITQITLDGATTVEQAYREAKYRLRLNQYLTRTVEHSADIDAIACQINDVVLLAHDVPQWGYSGRLLDATATTLQLDREVTLEPNKSYAVALQITNPGATTPQEVQNIETVGVEGVTQKTVTSTLTLRSPLATVPAKWDLYSFGETTKAVKPFRVLNISRDQDLKRKITCLEYIEEIYNEATDIPQIQYSAIDPTPEVSGLSVAEETYRQKDGTMGSNLNVSWNISRTNEISSYKVLYSSDEGKTWTEWCSGLKKLSTAIIGVKTATTYLVKVCTINILNTVSTGVLASVYVTGKDHPPSNVVSVAATIEPTDATKIILSWPAVEDIDLAGYRIREGATIVENLAQITTYTYSATKSRAHAFSVVAVDNSGNESVMPAEVTIPVKVEPADVQNFVVGQRSSDRSYLDMSWEAVADTSLSHYEIRVGTNDDWDSATVIATQLKATFFETRLVAEGYYTLLIKAVNVAGYSSITPAVTTLQYILKPNAPTGGNAVQSIQDKSILNITWTTVTDKDLLEYEVRLGTIWENGVTIIKTRETSCQYRTPASGTYNFMVRARNISVNLSSILNIQYTADLNPSDVTGFAIAASLTDRRILNCSWTAVADADLVGYEIRQGSNWSTATPVAPGIKGNFCSIQFAGGNATFLIKAVNISGNYSDVAARQTVAISATPNMPGAGSVVADPQNRLKLTLNWAAVTDTDIQDYEIRLGTVWGAAILIGNKKETSCPYIVTTGGTYNFLVAARTVGNQYSQPRLLTANVVQEPSDVVTFTASQNPLDRRIINFAWSAVADTDLLGYEIRKGTNWDTAEVVISDTKTVKHDYTATVEEVATFLIKAITVGSKYSINAKTVTIPIQLKPNKPGDGGIVQDDNNSAIQILSWGAVTDADLIDYEIRKGLSWAAGTLITTTKELSYRYTATDGSALSFWVAAKNIGENYSQAIQLTTVPSINPQDVTDFTATQLIQDHSKVRLSWSAVNNKDFSHYEIREGINWDSSMVVGNRVTGLFFDATINAERLYNYWVKAYNIAGQGSLNPTNFSSIFNMRPTTPENLVVETDCNDKTKLNITWNPIGDQDLKEYELRVGLTWDDAQTVIIARTKETKAVWYPPESRNYHFILAAKNNTNWMSDVTDCNFTANIEPANVSAFQAIQNGANSLLMWDKVEEADVVGYEIREGSSFDNGALVTTGINTLTHQVPVDTEKTFRYWIKAINRAGKYSQGAIAAEVTISGLPPKNVLEEFDEIFLQSGIHTNTEFGPSLIHFGNFGGRFSDYPNTKLSDIGGQTVLRLQPVNLIDDYHFDEIIDLSKWSILGGTATITKNADGNLLATSTNTTAASSGVRFKLPRALERDVVYRVEVKYRASTVGGLSFGFLDSDGSDYAASTCIPTSVTNMYPTASQFVTEVFDFTVGESGIEPSYFLFGWRTRVAGDTFEIEYAKIYKKSGQTGIYTYEASGEYLAQRKDVGQVITANLASQFVSTNLITFGVNAKLQYRTSRDGVTFTAWADFQPVMVTFRYVDFKVVMVTADPTKTPEVNIFKPSIDVPDTDKAGTATIAAGGTMVNYGYTFWDYPAVAPTAIGAGLRAELQSVGTSSFVVKVLNAAGTSVSGQITWIARGY